MDYETMRLERSKAYHDELLKSQEKDLIRKIPIRYRNLALADYRCDYEEQRPIKGIIHRYLDSFHERLLSGNSLIFCGRPGTGKTMLAMIIYAELVKRRYQVKYESSLNFLRELKEKEFESIQGYERLLQLYSEFSLLIIDEVTEGVGKGSTLSDWERQQLFKLINRRYEKKLPSLVITNRTKAELSMILGEALLGRLSEDGIYLAFNWPSYRTINEQTR